MCCCPRVARNPSCATGLWHSVSYSGYSGSYISHMLLMFTLFSCLPKQMPCFQFYIHNCLIGCEYKILTSAVLVVVNMVMIVIMIMK